MKRRNLAFFVLTLTLALTLNLTVKAANDTVVSYENGDAQIDETIGIIESIDGDFLHISGEALTYGGLDEVVVQVGDAPVYDLLTGLPVRLNAVKAGMEARVVYMQQGAAHPPQAMVIWLHPSHEDAAVFSAVVSDSIYYGPDYTVFLSADGRYRITLTQDTYILVPGHGPIAPEDIEPGQEFFVWVDMITASSPALVFPDKVVYICG